MNVKLSRKQELKLIELGMQKLLEQSLAPARVEKVKRVTKRWSPKQHRKFKATMKKVWASKRNGESK
jgi:hypothetical protein